MYRGSWCKNVEVCFIGLFHFYLSKEKYVENYITHEGFLCLLMKLQSDWPLSGRQLRIWFMYHSNGSS